MKKFKLGQRVRVLRDYYNRLDVNADGEVVRECRGDDSAWIALDRRHDDARVHTFPATDEGRACHVRAYPEDCEKV